MGLPGKEEVAGADVHVLYAAGALDRIAAYCMTDVVQTWLLFLRYRLVEGSLTPDGYDESVASVRERASRLLARRSLLPRSTRALDGFSMRGARASSASAAARRRARRAQRCAREPAAAGSDGASWARCAGVRFLARGPRFARFA